MFLKYFCYVAGGLGTQNAFFKTTIRPKKNILSHKKYHAQKKSVMASLRRCLVILICIFFFPNQDKENTNGPSFLAVCFIQRGHPEGNRYCRIFLKGSSAAEPTSSATKGTILSNFSNTFFLVCR